MKTVIRVQFQRTFDWLKSIQIIRKHGAAEQLEFDMESIMPSTSTENDHRLYTRELHSLQPDSKIEEDE